MRSPGIVLTMAVFLAPIVVAGQSGFPPHMLSASGVEEGLPWVVAQMVPGPPPGPGPRPPRDMGPGMGAWWKRSEVVKRLGLSETQVGQIEQTFLEHRLRLVDLRADLEKQELLLQPLLDADRPDEANVVTQIDRITTARGKLEKQNAMMMLAIRRVPSAE